MKVPFHNKKSHPVHLGGAVIQPDEVRFVEERDHPSYQRKKPMAAPVESYMQILVKANAAEVKAEVELVSDDDLNELLTLESAGKNRKGVIEAIEAEKLARAAGGGEGNAEKEAEAFFESLKESGDDDLLALLESEEDEGKKALINAEIEARTGGSNE